MVTVESLRCGTPVVGFKVCGHESIALPDYVSFVEYGNLQTLSEVLDEFVDRVMNKTEISEKAISTYSKERMAQAYLEAYQKILK